MKEPEPLEVNLRNEFSGTAGNVVQAGVFHGEVNIYASPIPQQPAPWQLPKDIAYFTGRLQELTMLDTLLEPGDGQSTGAVFPMITGTAGVGKTALAVHWAHRARRHFPDGCLYVNMRGYGLIGPPEDPGEVLADLLRSLGLAPSQIPPKQSEREGMYRSMLDAQNILVVLDNAVTAEQVRPLLPGSAKSMVIVTSRQDLSGLAVRDGARRIQLDLMSPDEAIILLGQVLGHDRVDAEPGAIATLAQQCAYLPLALRIAADRATARPRLGLYELVNELTNERNRLDMLATTDDPSTAVRAVFSWSYQALPTEAARMFRLLGLHVTPEFSTWAAAALADIGIFQAQGLLRALTDMHLIDETTHDRYRLHDLLIIYANECAMADESEQDRGDAVRRVLLWYLHTAESADRNLMPPRRRVSIENLSQHCKPLSFTSHGQALNWCEAERPNLTAATRQAADQGEHSIAWQIPVALISFFNLRKPWADWITTHDIGLAATKRIGNREGEGWILGSVGIAYRDLREYEKAVECLLRALAIAREIKDLWGEGTILFNLGDVYRRQQREHEAIDCLEQAQTAFQGANDRWGTGMTLLTLSGVYRGLPQSDDAIACLQQALTIFREIDDGYSACLALNNLGDLCQQLHLSYEAHQHFQDALGVARKIGDRYDEAWALNGLGRVLCEMSDRDAARECWRQALGILEELGSPHVAEVRARLQSIETDDNHGLS